MMSELAPHPTPTTERYVGLLGDLHGDTHFTISVANEMRRRKVTVLLQMGDFGFLNMRLELSNLLWLDSVLSTNDQLLYFVDGNHDNFPELYRYPVDPNGVRWVTGNIGHLHRGYRTTLAGGLRLAALGGANSVDAWRGHWEGESITVDNLAKLGSEPADLMIGHDAPLNVSSLDQFLSATDYRWPASGREYSASGRAMFHRGFMQVRPRLYIGGHYHHFVDQLVTFCTGEGTFNSRVVLLDAGGPRQDVSQAILDTSTLDVEFFALDDEPGESIER
jgi:Calcineurin-like phosphoesterase